MDQLMKRNPFADNKDKWWYCRSVTVWIKDDHSAIYQAANALEKVIEKQTSSGKITQGICRLF